MKTEQDHSMSGYFYNGSSSERQKVVLRIVQKTSLSDALFIIEHEDLTTQSFQSHEVSAQDLSGADSSLQMGPFEFEPLDGQALRQLSDNLDLRLFKRSYLFKSLFIGLCVTATAVFCFFYLLIFIVTPAITPTIANMLPEDILDKPSEVSFKQLERYYFKPSTVFIGRQQHYIDTFYKTYPEAKQANLKILFRSADKIGANAMAFPNGVIVVTDDFMELVASPDELNAVLLHEWAHVKHQHALQQVIQHSIFAAGFFMVAGDLELLTDSILDIAPALLVSMQFSRSMEQDADNFAIKTMKEHGKDPSALADMLLKLHMSGLDEEHIDDENQGLGLFSKLLELLSTHPDMEERVEYVKEKTLL